VGAGGSDYPGRWPVIPAEASAPLQPGHVQGSLHAVGERRPCFEAAAAGRPGFPKWLRVTAPRWRLHSRVIWRGAGSGVPAS